MRAYQITPGETFGRLTILGAAGSAPDGRRLVKCRCICGTNIIRRFNDVRHGSTRSCGCLITDTVRDRCQTHGRSHSPEYVTWSGMIRRCTNQRSKDFKHYGGRGIAVCQEWLDSLERFLADMGPCPPGYTLERRDNNGPYSATNCHWASRKEQAGNTRRNRMITFNGRTLSMTEWARECGLSTSCLQMRLVKLHWPPEKALTAPVRPCDRSARTITSPAVLR